MIHCKRAQVVQLKSRCWTWLWLVQVCCKFHKPAMMSCMAYNLAYVNPTFPSFYKAGKNAVVHHLTLQSWSEAHERAQCLPEKLSNSSFYVLYTMCYLQVIVSTLAPFQILDMLTDLGIIVLRARCIPSLQRWDMFMVVSTSQVSKQAEFLDIIGLNDSRVQKLHVTIWLEYSIWSCNLWGTWRQLIDIERNDTCELQSIKMKLGKTH